MKLKILLPTEVLIDQTVTKINAEAENGCFCILEHHIDWVTALVPSVLSFTVPSGKETFLAVDEGILVKQGSEVLVSTRHGILGDNLETLKNTVEKEFQSLDEREKLTRSALAQFEANMMRRFQELGLK
jgi:F-type H+-transporting ATPase subunit epsilon